MQRYVSYTLLASVLALGCSSGPVPPDGYQRSFLGHTTFFITYDDPTVPPETLERSYDIDLLGTGEEDTYSTRIGGVSPEGVVQMSPVPFPILCSYVSTSGTSWDITFFTSDINWSENGFDVYLDGSFTNSAAQTGHYTMYVDGF